MSLFEELIEDRGEDEKIVGSFKPKDSLSNQIFEVNGKSFSMRDEIRKRLLEITNDFVDSLNVDVFIHDIVLTGSLSNYNWSQYSDVDLHILIDFDSVNKDKNSSSFHAILKEFFDAKKNVWNEKHDIKIKGYDVEIYVQDIDEEHISSGVYSILNNEWVVEPKKEEANIDDRKILEKGEEYAKKIDKLIKLGDKRDVTPDIETLRKKIKELSEKDEAVIKLRKLEKVCEEGCNILAEQKLIVLTKWKNNGWKPNWKDSNEYKYFIWWNMENNCFYDVDSYYRGAVASSRLCFLRIEDCEEAVNKFAHIYENSRNKSTIPKRNRS
jgi:hypothetical protein